LTLWSSTRRKTKPCR